MDDAATDISTRSLHTGLVGLEDGFRGYYRPDQAAWDDAFVRGIVVLDTNALLDLYRLSPRARNELLSLLAAMRERIFVPHQVAVEFHRRRIDAVSARQSEFTQALDEVGDIEARLKGLVRRVAIRAHGGDAAAAPVLEATGAAVSNVAAFVQAVADEYDLDADELTVAARDPVLAALGPILAGRVAPQPGQDVLKADKEEAARRAKELLPPGFKDSAKKENPFGDYLWWAETVRFAAGKAGPVLLVCNDVAKGDWTYESRGFRIGPNPMLVDEMAKVQGGDLLLCTTAQLLSQAAKALRVEVSDRTLAETAALPDRPVGTGGGQNYIPLGWATELTDVQQDQIDDWVERGWLTPPERSMWNWHQLRLMVLLHEMTSDGIDAATVTRVVTEMPVRTSSFNHLVVTTNEVRWVRRHEAIAQLQAEDPSLVFVFDARPIERRMRRVQMHLQRADRGMGDVRTQDEDDGTETTDD